MGKYDLKADYDKNQVYTLNDLVNEIIKENGKTYECFAYFKNKFTNNKQSGIIDKLKSQFDFDVDKLSENNAEQNFKKLKLLKYLYYLDKHIRRRTRSKNYDEFVFLDMLSKPRLSNFKTILPSESVHNDKFKNVSDTINPLVIDYVDYTKRMYDIRDNWEYLLNLIFTYYTEDSLPTITENLLNKLNRIKNDIKEIKQKLDNLNLSEKTSTDIFETFWFILNSHMFLAQIEDNITIITSESFILDKNSILPGSPPKDYITKFVNYDGVMINWKDLNSQDDSTLSKELFEMSVYCQNYPKAEKDYIYALKYAKNIADIVSDYMDYDFTSQIKMPILISIIQEIIYFKNVENREKKRIKNNYFRTTNKYQSLSSAFTQPKKASSIQILTWAKRIQHRIVVNMGQPDLIIKYREIETSISEIEQHIFSIRNISDMELVSNVLINKIIDTIPEDDIAMQFSHVLFFDIADQSYFENFKPLIFNSFNF